jgi:ABC-type branched-subunit amino acid transport system ATPase component
MAAITVEGLTKRFGEVLAVDRLDFRVGQGTVTGDPRRPAAPARAGAVAALGAASALTTPGDGTLPMWARGLVFAAYGLALAGRGGRLVVRRDLT